MKKAIFIPLIIVIALLQVTILEYFKVFGVKPDLLLAAAVVASLFPFELKWSLPLSLLAGLLRDIFQCGHFGKNTLLFFLLGLLASRASRKISTDHRYVRLAFIFAAVILKDTAARAISFFSAGEILPAGIFLRLTFLEGLYTVIAAAIILKAVRFERYL